MKTGFRIIRGSGFHIKFNNNVIVSVQFGWGNYCNKYPDNKDMFTEDIKFISNWKDPLPMNGSPNAEVAIFYEDGEWITAKYLKEVRKEKDGDNVIGFFEPDEIIKILKLSMKQITKRKRYGKKSNN